MSVLIDERDGPVARLTLNRPESGNALDLELATELAAASALHGWGNAAMPMVPAVFSRLPLRPLDKLDI